MDADTLVAIGWTLTCWVTIPVLIWVAALYLLSVTRAALRPPPPPPPPDKRRSRDEDLYALHCLLCASAGVKMPPPPPTDADQG